jgi:uncharacterized protein
MANEQTSTKELMENDRARIFLQPIASPWVLGLFGFSIAAFVMGGKYAGWFNGAGANAVIYVAVAALLGGFSQFVSAMWAFKSRDALSTAFNGIWGTFWLAVGFMNLVIAHAAPAAGAAAPVGMGGIEMGFFFIPLSLITAACVASSIYHSKALVSSLVILTGACVLMTIGLLAGSVVLQMIGGWCFVISTAFAWYSATVALIASSYAKARMPVQAKEGETINEGLGEPGVVHDIGAKMPNLTVLRRAGANR